MANILQHPQSYILGQLEIKRAGNSSGRFTLEGNFSIEGNPSSDHLQLIYEALVIAAHSTDQYAPQFKAMCVEFLALTADWDK